MLSFGLNKKGAKFCNFPCTCSTQTITKGLFINNHTDFGMRRIIFNGKKGTCNSTIRPPSWETAITIKDGGSISNLILGSSPIGTAYDIQCLGSCTLKNVFWENTCWRGASFRAQNDFIKKNTLLDNEKYTYIVDGGGALDGLSKIFLQTGPGKTIVKNFCAANCEIGLRSCGACLNQYQRDLTVVDSKFMGPGITIIGPNQQYRDKVTLGNVSVYGYNNKSTRTMFACSECLGESAKNKWAYSYEPGKPGTSNYSCNYPASAVKVIN
uniref:Probable pectate lyase F n=1 Tax=Meloidogyne hapla TaxID=6305 RepID=A0A1I8BMY7_MELHA